MQRLKNLLSTVGGVAVIVLMILLYNVQFAAVVGDPRIPSLQDKWWGGYFLNADGESVWCLVRFEESDRRKPRMVLITAVAEPILFEVQRSSSDDTFARLSMNSSASGLTISAKQLYEGKRYYTGRLMAGRWRDFWKKNDDIAIRGSMKSAYVDVPFEIEPLTDDRVLSFYRTYVSPGSTLRLEELSIGAAAAFRAVQP